MEKYTVYLFGVYDNNGNLRAVKIGQTARAVKTRLWEVQQHANTSACLYNKGLHIILATMEVYGIDAGVCVEGGIHHLIQERHSTIRRFPHSKDYFAIARGQREKTLIKRFYACGKEVASNNNIACRKAY